MALHLASRTNIDFIYAALRALCETTSTLTACSEKRPIDKVQGNDLSIATSELFTFLDSASTICTAQPSYFRVHESRHVSDLLREEEKANDTALLMALEVLFDRLLDSLTGDISWL